MRSSVSIAPAAVRSFIRFHRKPLLLRVVFVMSWTFGQFLSKSAWAVITVLLAVFRISSDCGSQMVLEMSSSEDPCQCFRLGRLESVCFRKAFSKVGNTGKATAGLEHAHDSIFDCGLDVERGSLWDCMARLLSFGSSPRIDRVSLLESFHGGAWVPVCKSGFPSDAASAACTAMGVAGVRASENFSICPAISNGPLPYVASTARVGGVCTSI